MSKKHKKGKTTQAQKTANQKNAQKSTGPQSPEGKEKVSQNAQRHGLTSLTFKLLPWEDPQAFEAFKQDTFAEYAPKTSTQEALVLKIVQHTWRIQRAFSMEAQELERAEARGDENLSMILERYRRYVVSFERLLKEAKHDLEALQYPQDAGITNPILIKKQKQQMERDRKTYLQAYEQRLEAMSTPPVRQQDPYAAWEEYKATLSPEERAKVQE